MPQPVEGTSSRKRWYWRYATPDAIQKERTVAMYRPQCEERRRHSSCEANSTTRLYEPFADGTFGEVRALQHCNGVPIELVARVRRPADQPDVKRGLELLETMAHSRLRHVQIAAGSGDAAALHDSDEIAEVVEIEHRLPPSKPLDDEALYSVSREFEPGQSNRDLR
jgi:hypothetical protein